MIVFTEEKKFSREDVQELFLSVGWISGQYPGRLFKALMKSSTVVTAWDGDRLAGLVVERSRDKDDVHNVRKNYGTNVRYLKEVFQK